jgi:hypothetical protein
MSDDTLVHSGWISSEVAQCAWKERKRSPWTILQTHDDPEWFAWVARSAWKLNGANSFVLYLLDSATHSPWHTWTFCNMYVGGYTCQKDFVLAQKSIGAILLLYMGFGWNVETFFGTSFAFLILSEQFWTGNHLQRGTCLGSVSCNWLFQLASTFQLGD